MQSSARAQGTIITFYSYKGGTGRSMMLANIAWLLASRSHRVLVIDWDLEAPGLHRYFLPFLNDKDLTSSNGVIDFIVDFAVKASENPDANGRARTEEWWGPYTNILRYASSLQWDFPNKGALDFVSAGRQSASYSTRVNSFNWQSFYDVLGGGGFLEAVKERIRNEYDYILIDSRTGLSDTAGICTVQMPDILVSCFTLNSQSIEGAAMVAKSIFDQRQGTPFRIFPVPTRTDNAELEKRLLRLEYAQDMFDAVLGHIPAVEREEYWGVVEVPYVPFYSYEEMLASFRDSPSHPVSLLAPFEMLTGYLTSDFTRTPIVADEARRTSVLNEFGSETSINYDVFLAHAREDAGFAEQLARRLRREKVRGRKLRVFTMASQQDSTSTQRKNQSALNRSKTSIIIVAPDLWTFGTGLTYFADKVIWIYHREAEIPEQYRSNRFVDFRNATELSSAVEKLVEILRDPAALETLPTFSQDISAQLLSSAPDIGFVTRHDTVGESLVDLLRKELSGDPPSTVVLWGAGGVGKTTLAAETMRGFDSTGNKRVIWLNIQNTTGPIGLNATDTDYSSLLDGILTKLDQINARSLEDAQKLLLLRSVASTNAALIVLDGFERLSVKSQSLIERNLINSPPCPILITTRKRVHSARNVLLSGFSMDEVNECINRWLKLHEGKPAMSVKERKRIYDLTDGLPLALHLVLGYLMRQENYAEAIDTLDKSSGPTVERVLTVAFDFIAKDHRARLTVLALSLFSPSASAEAITEVAGYQRIRKVSVVLTRLKNLRLIEESDVNNRYALHDAVRAYVNQRLAESKDAESLQRRFIDYFLRYVLDRSDASPANFEALDLERDNILNAVTRANAARNWSVVVQFGRAMVLKDKWLVACKYLDHASSVAEMALEAARESKQAEDIVAFASAAASIRVDRSEYAKAADIYDRASSMLAELHQPECQSIVLHSLGRLHANLRNYEGASEYYTHSLRLSRTDPETSASNLASLSELQQRQGNYESALTYLEEALRVIQQINDPAKLGHYLQRAGSLAMRGGKLEIAEKYFLESLNIYKGIQADRGAAQALSWLGTISLRREDFAKAREFYTEALKIFRHTESSSEIASCLQGLGRVAQAEGNFELALKMYKDSLAIRENIGDQRGIAYTLYDLGTAAQDLGDATDARQFYTESLEGLRQVGDQNRVAATLTQLGRIYETENNVAEAVSAYQEAVEILKRLNSPRAKSVQARLRSLKQKSGGSAQVGSASV